MVGLGHFPGSGNRDAQLRAKVGSLFNAFHDVELVD